ncbi:hypothetical protein KHQ82_05345 [Mycoplasmatota bacterium]|nr:hypothetical protein KHQ82_05345 [Mycoplasmatota bacterium]
MSFIHKTFKTYDELREELQFLELRKIVLESRGTKKELKICLNRITELKSIIDVIESRIEKFAENNDRRYKVLYLRIVKRRSNPEIADDLDYSIRHVRRICSDFNKDFLQSSA